MAKMTTMETYEAAQKLRAKIAPLSQGRYKLAEGLHTMSRSVVTLERQGKAPALHGAPLKPSLPPLCSDNEFGRWAKGVPTLIADIYGYDILPAIKALEGDGLSSAEVANILAASQSEITTLLHNAESVRGDIPSKGLLQHTIKDLLGLAREAAKTIDRICARVAYNRSEAV